MRKDTAFSFTTTCARLQSYAASPSSYERVSYKYLAETIQDIPRSPSTRESTECQGSAPVTLLVALDPNRVAARWIFDHAHLKRLFAICGIFRRDLVKSDRLIDLVLDPITSAQFRGIMKRRNEPPRND